MAARESFLDSREEFRTERRPAFQGCNIGTWIGFKQLTYLAQDGVLDCLRAHGLAPGTVFDVHGLGTEFVGCRLRLLKGTRVDDVVTVAVTPAAQPAEDRAAFDVSLLRRGEAGQEKLAQGRLAVQWRHAGADLGPAEPPPPYLLPFVVADEEKRPRHPGTPLPPELAATDPDGLLQSLRPAGKAAVVRCQRVTYPLCHYTERLQFSAYALLLEALVDALLAERGISIGTLLAERRWIPVVSRVAVEALRPVYMEEALYSVFYVEEVLKDVLFTGRMECHVLRDGRLTPAAVGSIDHAYVQFDTRAVGSAVTPLDARVKRALLGE